MANPIVVGSTYFIDFENGNGTVGGPSSYFSYAADQDTNFVTLQNTVNSVISEVNAIAGPNALFGQDLMFLDDPTIATVTTTGRIGTNVVIATINGGDPARIDLTAGAMSLIGLRTDVIPQSVIQPGAAASGTYFLAMDANGIVSIQAAGGAAIADIYSMVWDTGIDEWTSITNLIETFLDGDEWYEMREEPAGTIFAGGAGELYFGAHSRLDNYSRVLSGYLTNSDGDPIGPVQIGPEPAAGEAFLAGGDGAGAADVGTGLVRSAADELTMLADGVAAEVWSVDAQVTHPAQAAGYVSLASQAITTGAGQVIAFDTELFDRQNQHASGTVSIGTVGQAGLYQINAEGVADESTGGATPGPLTLEIRDGSTVRAKAEVTGVGSGGGRVGFNLSALLEFSNGDTFDVFATQGSAASLTFSDLRLSWSKVG